MHSKCVVIWYNLSGNCCFYLYNVIIIIIIIRNECDYGGVMSEGLLGHLTNDYVDKNINIDCWHLKCSEWIKWQSVYSCLCVTLVWLLTYYYFVLQSIVISVIAVIENAVRSS